MSVLVEGIFGSNRDIFVGICIGTISIFWLPISIVGYPSGYAQPGKVFTCCAFILVIASLFFIITSILNINNKCIQRIDLMYFFVILMLFVGDALFLVFAIQFSTDSCTLLYGYGNNYYFPCWIADFSSYFSLFLMIAYLIILIFAMRYNGFVGIFYNIQQFCKSNPFRVIWLFITTFITIIFVTIYIWLFHNKYTIQFRIWLYLTIILNVLTIIISFINYLIKPICIKYKYLTIWWFLCLAICLFGCYAYYDNAIIDSDASAYWGEAVMWQFCNIWLLTETSLPFITQIVQYQSINQV